MSTLSHLQIRNPKDDETPLEAATQIFSSLLPAFIPLHKQWLHPPNIYSLELYLLNQTIYFYITCGKNSETFIHSLVASSYPSVAIKKTTDPLELVMKSHHKEFGELSLTNGFFLPTKTYVDFSDIDPLSSVLGFLAKRTSQEQVAIQILLTPASFPWAKNTITLSTKQIHDAATDKSTSNPHKQLMMQKAAFQGGRAIIRMLAGGPDQVVASTLLGNLAGTFGSFSLGEGNQYAMHKVHFGKQKHLEHMLHRSAPLMEHRYQVLNSQELATIWHPPGLQLAGIKNIAWGKTLAGEPPENLPVAKNIPEEERKNINFFGTAEYKNEEQIFGVKNDDRRKHMYVVGKTGAGKSTLIANMAIDDIRKGRGVGVIDPHGDLSEIILDYIPNRRLQDVVYLEPFDTEFPFHLNVLENKSEQHSDLIASGIVSIFNKLYKDSWGPRLEYILRNVILTLVQIPGSTLPDVLPLIGQDSFRQKIIPQLKDPVLINFWTNEFEKMSDKMKTEAISPIQNKVGQFISSVMIRNIIGHRESTIDLEEIMDNKKILIMNLSQGKLGEDNAALLGAMIINQIQLTAMSRAFRSENDRTDFFLYVDEFQNFATSSFVKILSEARKYHLSLTLANQYIDQIEETIQHAIFGNIGTLISFVVGSRDSELLSKEFGEIYTQADLVSLGKFEVVMKICIDNMTSMPFPARTLSLPSVKNNNREKIVELSKEKYGRKVTKEELDKIEADIATLKEEMQKPKPAAKKPYGPPGSRPPQQWNSSPRPYEPRGDDQRREPYQQQSRPPYQSENRDNRDSRPYVPPERRDNQESKPYTPPERRDNQEAKPYIAPEKRDNHENKPYVAPERRNNQETKPYVAPERRDNREDKPYVSHNRPTFGDKFPKPAPQYNDSSQPPAEHKQDPPPVKPTPSHDHDNTHHTVIKSGAPQVIHIGSPEKKTDSSSS